MHKAPLMGHGDAVQGSMQASLHKGFLEKLQWYLQKTLTLHKAPLMGHGEAVQGSMQASAMHARVCEQSLSVLHASS